MLKFYYARLSLTELKWASLKMNTSDWFASAWLIKSFCCVFLFDFSWVFPEDLISTTSICSVLFRLVLDILSKASWEIILDRTSFLPLLYDFYLFRFYPTFSASKISFVLSFWDIIILPYFCSISYSWIDEIC